MNTTSRWLQKLISASFFLIVCANSLAAAPPKLVLPNTESLTISNRPAFIFLPAMERRTTPHPWIFYAPTLPGYPDEAERWMHEQFLAAGIAVAGIDAGEAYAAQKVMCSSMRSTMN
jgi:hypothetical protein